MTTWMVLRLKRIKRTCQDHQNYLTAAISSFQILVGDSEGEFYFGSWCFHKPFILTVRWSQIKTIKLFDSHLWIINTRDDSRKNTLFFVLFLRQLLGCHHKKIIMIINQSPDVKVLQSKAPWWFKHWFSHLSKSEVKWVMVSNDSGWRWLTDHLMIHLAICPFHKSLQLTVSSSQKWVLQPTHIIISGLQAIVSRLELPRVCFWKL